MRVPAFLLLAAALSLAPLAAHAGEGQAKSAAFPFPMDVQRLPNGLTLVLVDFDSPGIAAFYALVRTGSRNEVEPGRSGYAHFFEHMMFRGTERYPSALREELLARAGVANNAFTTDDFTAYHSLGPAAQLPLVLDIDADRFRNLAYSRDDFRTEARTILGEYNKSFSNPGRKLDEAMRDTAFVRHPYKHTVMGFREDIEAMPEGYEYSLEFFRRWYTPDNTTLIVAGDFDHEQIRKLIEEKWGPWQGKVAAIEIPAEPPQKAKKAVHVSWQSPTQPLLALAWHAPATRVDTKDAAIQAILGPYLFGPTSPLYRELVLDSQLATAIWGGGSDNRDPGLFSAGAALKDAKSFPVVQDAFAKFLNELRAGHVDEKRLADVVSAHKYGLLGSLDNANAVAETLVGAMGPTGDPHAIEALFDQMAKITPQDLTAFANKWLVDSNLTEVTLTGPGDKGPAGVPEYVPSAHPAATKKGGAK